ncbi:hypothetical protein [Maridesulfovibrio hydrothermalis]|uniref:Uncharacterized protein n=1 Tax=Maridesulfovibrio hydrothermalis AM13 = DSM 14728 TaxID=1121451 RepID=L0RGI6_9BACT|nr:hypothetical protein [Maridesulfovibrio hydrothermalis]CCO24686.1 conserved membrane protein of unknown function [Maridesulfovibrio hydrothermalis AM13 = DSM 14728]
MTQLILAGLTLLAIIGISIYAWKKGQSGFGVFFLLYSVISVIVYIVMIPDEMPFNIYDILGQIGVIICSAGIIYAHATGKRKIIYALPGLIVLGIAIAINIGKVPPPTTNATANGTSQTVIMGSNQTE